MSKKVTSVSIDEALAKRLEHDEHVNASGLFNQFLKEYYSTGSADGLELRLQQVEREIDETKADLERLEDERDRLLEMKEQRDEDREPELEEALDVLASIPDEKLGPKNPAVMNHANSLGIAPQRLAEKAKGQPAD